MYKTKTLAIMSLVFLILLDSIVMAENIIPAYVRGRTASSSFDFTFNFTSDVACSNVLKTVEKTIATDANGIGFASLDISDLTTPPAYMCEYQDGVLIAAHIWNNILTRNITVNTIKLIDVGGNYLSLLSDDLESNDYSITLDPVSENRRISFNDDGTVALQNKDMAFLSVNTGHGANELYDISPTSTPQFTRLGIGTAAGSNGYEVLDMEFARANSFGGTYIKNTEGDGITRFSVGMTHDEGTLGILSQYDAEDGRGLFLNRNTTVGTMELITAGGGAKVLTDGGVEMLPVYSDTISSNVRDLQIDDAGRLGYVSSSIRYKENIRNLTGSEKIYDLQPVLYDRKGSNIKDEVGLIAEDVEQIMPELISYKREEIFGKLCLAPDDCYNGIIGYRLARDTSGELIPETINYKKLIIPLLKEVQQLRIEIELLKNE